MRKVRLFILPVLSVLWAVGVGAGDFSLRGLKLDHPDGFYSKGSEIVVTGTLLRRGRSASGYKLRVNVRPESVRLAETRDFPCNGKPFRVSFTSDEPGWVYFTFQVIGPDGKVVQEPAAKVVQRIKKDIVGEIGAMVAAEDIRPADERPADFEEFWENEIAKLNAVPMNPRLEKIESGKEGIDLYTVKLDAGVSRPVTGYLAVPTGAKDKAFPIYLTFLSGVVGDANRNEAVGAAERGAVALITTWHGFDVGRDQKYYKENCGKIQAWKTAAGGRDAFYYREMYLRALRAAQYLKTRPEWNGRDFMVLGGSLAGSQAAAVAAFDPQVSIAFIHTTSLCGYNGDLAGRKRSLPFHWIKDSQMTPEMRKAVPYYDVVHIASCIRCESYFCTAFADEICTPSNVYSAYNNLPVSTKKHMFTNPRTGHYGTTVDFNARQRWNEFFETYWGPKGFRNANLKK